MTKETLTSQINRLGEAVATFPANPEDSPVDVALRLINTARIAANPEVATNAERLLNMSDAEMAVAADVEVMLSADFCNAIRSLAASWLATVPPDRIEFPKGPTGIPMEISDLFFNHEHPEYDRVMQNASDPGYTLGETEQRDALVTDATEFADAMAAAGNPNLDPGKLADDFLSRL